MNHFEKLEDLSKIVQSENLEVAVVSYGGCGSNTLAKCLSDNGIRSITNSWKKIVCHCPQPFESEIKFIYLHRDPEKAFLSMKRRGRGYWDLNQQKLANDVSVKLSDLNLKYLMLKQYYEWTHKPLDNVLVISFKKMFTQEGKERIEKFVGRELNPYPQYFTAS